MIEITKQIEDLTGKRFGMLTALYNIKQKSNNGKYTYYYWHCRCDCGKEKDISTSHLKSGETKSCGCLRDKKLAERSKKYNKYDLHEDYGIGYTTNDEEFYFDLEDYDKIKNYCWYKDKSGYIVTNVYQEKIKKNLRMHNLVLNEFIKEVDHINRKKNDNGKNNLRTCTHQENTINVGKKRNNTSGVVGVNYRKDRNKWRAEINVNNKCIYLGMFDDFNKAVKARKEAEEKYFGDFFDHASINGGEFL